MIEELGGSSQALNMIGGKKIVVKSTNNPSNSSISILRNRSTSPTIIQKKNLIRKESNTGMWFFLILTDLIYIYKLKT